MRENMDQKKLQIWIRFLLAWEHFRKYVILNFLVSFLCCSNISLDLSEKAKENFDNLMTKILDHFSCMILIATQTSYHIPFELNYILDCQKWLHNKWLYKKILRPTFHVIHESSQRPRQLNIDVMFFLYLGIEFISLSQFLVLIFISNRIFKFCIALFIYVLSN